MIKYTTGRLGLFFILRCSGSVFPRTLVIALPNALFAVVLHIWATRDNDQRLGEGNMSGVNMLWAGYTSVLGLLIVFRNNQAYTRFWEGTTLINQVRGEWTNAFSSLVAFCNQDAQFEHQVQVFQHTVVRLFSMLYCSALQQVCDLDDDCLEIIENKGMSEESLQFMQDSNDRCEVILQWIQRLVGDAHKSKVIQIDSPLLTRAYQELSRGFVNLNNARKIKDIPFPFPYAQMITCMLLVHWLVTPLIASQVIESAVVAGTVCFLATSSFWCLIYINMEIDQPFGEDPNDLPLRDMQRDFNQSLLTLMHPLAQKVPGCDEGLLRKTTNSIMSSCTNDTSPSMKAAMLKPSLTKALHLLESHHHDDDLGSDEHDQVGKMVMACSMASPSLRETGKRKSRMKTKREPPKKSNTWKLRFGFGEAHDEHEDEREACDGERSHRVQRRRAGSRDSAESKFSRAPGEEHSSHSNSSGGESIGSEGALPGIAASGDTTWRACQRASPSREPSPSRNAGETSSPSRNAGESPSREPSPSRDAGETSSPSRNVGETSSPSREVAAPLREARPEENEPSEDGGAVQHKTSSMRWNQVKGGVLTQIKFTRFAVAAESDDDQYRI